MGDQLERFVLTNRDAFDTEMPQEELWRRIQRKRKRIKPLEQFWRIAAILFLSSTVYLVLDRSMQSGANEGVVVEEMQEFGQVENYYTRLIAEKKQEIAEFDKSDLKRSFLIEIERLDVMYDELKNTYVKQNSTDRVVDAMISNLKLRIDILNQQLKILKKLNDAQNEKDHIKSI